MCVEIIGTHLEEIIIQCFADLEECVRVNPRAFEKFVQILAGTVDLFGQPSDAASLPRQFGFDEFANVEFFVRGMFLVFHWACRI